MSKNKTFHHVYLTFENDEHPVIAEWFASKISGAFKVAQVGLQDGGLRDDKLVIESFGGGTMLKLSFITDFLGDQQLYTSFMGHVLKLIEFASKYVEIKMHFESSDTRRNRFMLTTDLGLLINGDAPIELRAIGKSAKLLDASIVDMWVAGEPNACRKEVGRIRRMIREGNNYRHGLEWFIEKVRTYMPKDIALFIRTVDQPCGQVVYGSRAYDNIDYCDVHHVVYLDAVKAGKVPDVFNLLPSKDWNFDFIAFMVTMLEVIDNRREVFKTYGGAEVVPYEYIRTTMEDIIDHEATA